jgi:hypothetical protein
MPEIGDVMDVTIDELSPEQLQQLKDATNQFQMKFLMSFKKNRSGIPYLKSEMPRVLLPGEFDATSFHEKDEILQAFWDTAETVMGKHHTTFLGMFKQMMIGVFGPGMEKVFSRLSPHGYYTEVGETSSAQPTGAQLPTDPASSTKCWEPANPASSTQRWKSANATSSTSRRRTASPATSTRQYRSTSSTAEPISAYIWGNGVRFVWTATQFHLQDSSSQQQIAEEHVRWGLPRGHGLWRY